jgi:hypothetical protein
MCCGYAHITTGATTNESSIVTSFRDDDSSTVYSMSSLQESLQTDVDSVTSHFNTDSSITAHMTPDKLTVLSQRPTSQFKTAQFKTATTDTTAATAPYLYVKRIAATDSSATTKFLVGKATPLSDRAAQHIADTTTSKSEKAIAADTTIKSDTAVIVDDSSVSSDCSNTQCDTMRSVDDIIGFHSRATSMLMYHIMPSISSTNSKQTSPANAVVTELRDILTQLDTIDRSFTEVKYINTDKATEKSLDQHSSNMKYQLIIVGAEGYDKSDICNTLCGGIKVSSIPLYIRYVVLYQNITMNTIVTVHMLRAISRLSCSSTV